MTNSNGLALLFVQSLPIRFLVNSSSTSLPLSNCCPGLRLAGIGSNLGSVQSPPSGLRGVLALFRFGPSSIAVNYPVGRNVLSLLRPFPQQICPCLPNVVALWHELLSTLINCAFVTTACSSLSVISSLPRYALKSFMPVCVGPSGNWCSLTDIR